jgi:hypothetical protein
MKEAVRRRLLTLVLVAVLMWYTLVVPAPAAFVRHAGGPSDAEERGEGESGGRPPAEIAPVPAAASVDELDWPEYIGG